MIAYRPPRENLLARVMGFNAGRLGDFAFHRRKVSGSLGFNLL
jgi:hypothetical protein